MHKKAEFCRTHTCASSQDATINSFFTKTRDIRSFPTSDRRLTGRSCSTFAKRTASPGIAALSRWPTYEQWRRRTAVCSGSPLARRADDGALHGPRRMANSTKRLWKPARRNPTKTDIEEGLWRVLSGGAAEETTFGNASSSTGDCLNSDLAAATARLRVSRGLIVDPSATKVVSVTRMRGSPFACFTVLDAMVGNLIRSAVTVSMRKTILTVRPVRPALSNGCSKLAASTRSPSHSISEDP